MSDLATTDLARTWASRGPWAGIVSPGHFGATGAGVSIVTRDGLGIASLIAAPHGDAALARALKIRFGLDLPSSPRAVRSATHALVWAGPEQWLLIAEDRSGFADDLAALSGLAAVADQSHGKAVLRLSGGRIREALAKGCMLDLHPAAFPVGTTGLTSIAYIGVQIWRAADGPDGEAVFEIMVARSMAGSFWSWLSASVAEFGGVTTTGRG